MKIFLFLATALAAAGPCFASDPLTDLVPRSMRRPDGEGLLLVTLDATHQTPLHVEFATADGKSAAGIDVRPGAIGLLPLAAGRYCLRSVRSGSKRYRAECAPPFVDVTGDSVDFTGDLKFSLRGKTARVLERRLPGPPLPLGEADQAAIDAVLARGAARGVRTLLLSSPTSHASVLRLYPDGMAETEQFALNNASYRRYRWRGDDANIAIEHRGGRYDLAATADGWRGTETHGGGAPAARTLRGHELFAATSDPRCWAWDACAGRIASGMVASPDYTWVKNHARLAGAITLAFSLRARAYSAEPHDVEVVGSTLSKDLDQAVVEQFGDARFSAELAGPARRRMTIEFTATDGGPQVAHGALLD